MAQIQIQKNVLALYISLEKKIINIDVDVLGKQRKQTTSLNNLTALTNLVNYRSWLKLHTLEENMLLLKAMRLMTEWNML